LAAVLVARVCGQAEYGYYTLFLTFLVTAESFQAAIICTPYVVQSPSKSTGERDVHLGNSISLQVFIAGLIAVTVLVLAYVLPSHWIGDLPRSMIPPFAAAYFFILVREFLRQVLLADLDVARNLLFGGAVHLSLMAVLVVLAGGERLDARTAFVAIAGCSAVPSLGILWHKRRHIRPRMGQMASQLADNWRIGRWLAAQAAITIVSGPVYSWALMSFHGAASVALMGACILPVSILSPVVQALNAFLLPKASHAAQAGRASIKRLVLLSSFFVGVGFIIFPLLLGCFSDTIMTALFAGKYSPSGCLVFLFALWPYIVMTFTPFNAGLIARGATYVTFKSEMISLVLTISVGLPLTFYLGVWGVAISFFATRLCSRFYLLLAFRQYIR
jgi:O-antigen/teichoic acid export membrane protein